MYRLGGVSKGHTIMFQYKPIHLKIKVAPVLPQARSSIVFERNVAKTATTRNSIHE